MRHEIRSEPSFGSSRLCFIFHFPLVYYFPTPFRILFIRSEACRYVFFSAWPLSIFLSFTFLPALLYTFFLSHLFMAANLVEVYRGPKLGSWTFPYFSCF